MNKQAGYLMLSEISEAPGRFISMINRDVSGLIEPLQMGAARAIFTIARGSSDAAANILSYEFMAHIPTPMTSLPPSVFSLGSGVKMHGTIGLIISQSGASSDLVKACAGIKSQGGKTLLITNTDGSPASLIADVTIDMGAGSELAIPATKSVISTIAAGMSVLVALVPEYRKTCDAAAVAMATANGKSFSQMDAIKTALIDADSVYVIGRGAGYGAAQEIALKFKETAAIHAEAYSASEVLHGPLQLASKPLTVLMLDTGEAQVQDSLNISEARFRKVGAKVFRVSPADLDVTPGSPAAAAAILLAALYPLVHDVTIALGLDPDTPENLAKITDTV